MWRAFPVARAWYGPRKKSESSISRSLPVVGLFIVGAFLSRDLFLSCGIFYVRSAPCFFFFPLLWCPFFCCYRSTLKAGRLTPEVKSSFREKVPRLGIAGVLTSVVDSQR